MPIAFQRRPLLRLLLIGLLACLVAPLASAELDRLTKPPGSLGRLEELAVWLAGVLLMVSGDTKRPAHDEPPHG